MKMTLGEANERYFALAGMRERIFPVKLGFAIAENLESLKVEADRAEQERVKLCKLYADKDKDGSFKMVDSVVNGTPVKNYQVSEENRILLEKDLEELYKIEVDVKVRPVSESVFEKCESEPRYSTPSVKEICALSFMIEK